MLPIYRHGPLFCYLLYMSLAAVRAEDWVLVVEVLCHSISFSILPQHQDAFHLSYPWKCGSIVVICICFPNISDIFCHENDDGFQYMRGPLQSMRTLTRDDIHYNFWMISTTSWNCCKKIFSLKTAVYKIWQFPCFYECKWKCLEINISICYQNFTAFCCPICQHNIFSCLLSPDWAIMNGPGSSEVTLYMLSQRQQYS